MMEVLVSPPEELPVGRGREARPAELDTVRRGVPSQFLSCLTAANATLETQEKRSCSCTLTTVFWS